MTKDSPELPESRSWRDIPQQVKPRAMSGEGRRRMAMSVVRVFAGFAAAALVAFVAWEVAAVVRQNPGSMPEEAKSEKVKSLVLVTDGVLDRNWLAKTLSIPADATLMGLDLPGLRQRVLEDAQVSSASVVRNFPDTLTVRISERSPIARMMAQSDGQVPEMLFVARDGTAFRGTGFDKDMVETLPWVDGVKLIRSGRSMAPIAGMQAVGSLVACARLEAEGLYRNWLVISLAKLASDGELEVHTRDGMKVTFGTKEDYLRQIARLDLLVDSDKDPTRPIREVNLALGSQVPVVYGTAAPTMDRPAAAPATLSASSQRTMIAFPISANLHPDTHSEL